MTTRIDEMIQDIRSDELPQIDGILDNDQKKRIEDMVLSAISKERETLGEASLKTRKWNRRKLLTFFFAAALIFAFALTAGAAAEHDWDVALVNFMGISDADTVQLPDGNIQIGVSDVCSGMDYSSDPAGIKKDVLLTATSSIGDKNAAYIRFDTNYELPEDFDPERDYVLPEDMDLSVFLKNPEKNVIESTKGSVFTTIEENGKLIFLLYISNCQKLNKSYVSITMGNLYLYHDLDAADSTISEEPELLYEGSWSLDWKYSYRSNVKTKKVLKSINVDGTKCFLTHLEVSPLGIRFEGFANPMHRLSSPTRLDVDCVTFRDGRVLTIGGNSSSGLKDGIWLDGYCGIDILGEVLDVDEIESITIGGCEIQL